MDENREGGKEDDRKEGGGKSNGEVDGVNDGEDNREGKNGEGPELRGANVGGRTPSTSFCEWG